MAHIRRHPKSGRWQVRYRDPSNRERSRTFSRKSDAERFVIEVEGSKLRGEWTDPRLSRVTFGTWAKEVQAGRLHLADSTRERDTWALNTLVYPTFGTVPLISIEPAHIRAWVSSLTGRYAASTVHRAYVLLQMVLERAVSDGRLPRSPCRDIELPKVEKVEKRFLSIGEVEEFADTIDPRFSAFVLAGAYTGLRPGELAALRLDRLDLLRRTVKVEEPIKTPAARRTVTFPAFLADILAAHITAHPGTEGHVFPAAEGGPLHLSSFRRRHWREAVRASVGEPMRPHDLRHTHVALLIAEGEDPYVISKRLGHASISTTYDVYGHLFEGRDAEAADKLDHARARSAADTMRTPSIAKPIPLR